MGNDAIVKAVLEASGFNELNPVQKLALDAGLLEGQNMVLAAPTASGKTLVAEMAALNAAKKGMKTVYIVPLKALASEKYDEFREKYGPLGLKVGISIGDYDQADPWLGQNDIIIVTSEKLDSLLRHGIPWLQDVGLVVADEIHLLDAPDRGPTLEIVLTRLRKIANPAILALSATISNYEELAEWMGAKAVKSDYRPVVLYTGVAFEDSITFVPKRSMKIKTDMDSIVADTIEKNKQILIFINTRRGAEAGAEKLASLLKPVLKTEERQRLLEISGDIYKVLEHPTKQCEKLSMCIKNGAAFHHAGLAGGQRSMIEKAFRGGAIKVICATPTLAAGINLPSFRVVVRDLKRFSSFRGMDYLPILEIQQMLGRAGRPKYDKEGEGILLPKNQAEARYAWDNYIKGKPERIQSKLGVEPVLRMHVLSLIASEEVTTRKELLDFFFKTFYAHQYKELSGIERILDKVIGQLSDFRFIDSGQAEQEPDSGSLFKTAASLLKKQEGKLKATKIGKRVSELYIDPLTANHLVQKLTIASQRGLTDFSLLHTISNTVEMSPKLNLRKQDLEDIEELLTKEEKNLLDKPPNPWDFEYDDYLRSIKTAMLLEAWAGEYGEDAILENLGVSPGELRARLDIADWLLYSAQEMALLLGFMNLLKDVRKTRIRLKYGVKPELLPFVRLKGVGRARARNLYSNGIKSIADLRKIPLASLERILGPATAVKVKDQLGELDETD